jgi:hypothetical protein
MSVEILTYGALGARLNISPEAARSLAKRLRLPRSLSEDGRALVSVDLAEIHHTPQPPGRRQVGNVALLTAQVAALQAEIARLEASAAGHRGDFERERERADRLIAELLQAAAETTAAKEAVARLEASSASHHGDFVRECERADRLIAELRQATAETTAAKEAVARLEGEVVALRTSGRTVGPIDGRGQAERRLGHLAASLVEADRKAGTRG